MKIMKTADMHCDTLSRLYQAELSQSPVSLLENSFQLDLKKMNTSGYILQNFAAFVDLDQEDDPYDACMKQIHLFYREMKKNQSLISPVTCYSQILENQKQHKMSALLTIEEGQVCLGDLKKLQEFYNLGVRMMTFTWNHKNSLGIPAEPADGSCSKGGLTHLGIAFLDAMEQLGIIPDVSHLSDEGISDVCRLAKKPFAASHSNARFLCGRQRNLPDELIKKISKRDGIIGINYYGPFLTEIADSHGTCFGKITDVAKHIRHITNIGGISCAGLGSDFDGIDDNLEFKDCSHLELLAEELKKNHFHESEIDAVFFQNVLSFYQEVLP